MNNEIELYDNHALDQSFSKTSQAMQISTDNPKETVDKISQLVYPAIHNRNIQLENENKLLKAQLEEYTEYKDAYSKKSIELDKCKEKLEQAQKCIKALGEAKQSENPRTSFEYEYDITDYPNYVNIPYIENLFDTCLSLAQQKTGQNTYLIEGPSDVVIIFELLTDPTEKMSPIYKFAGTNVHFCSCWNTNVVSRIDDSERAKKLTLNQNSFRSLQSQNVCTDPPSTWKSRSLEGSSKAKKYGRAFNIKERMEKSLHK